MNNKCLCVGKHIPLPHKYFTVDGVDLCPTSYYNLLSLLNEWEVFGGEPPGYVRKHYSDFIQKLAREYERH